MAKVFVFTAVS